MGRLNLRNIALARKRWIVLAALLPLFAYGAINSFDLLKANRLDVDNVRIDGNTISTTNANGDLTLDMNGSGSVIFTDLTATTVPYLDGTKQLTSSAVTPTELGFLTGVTASLCGISQSCTLTNKSINADSNTITNIDNSEIKAGAAIDRAKLASGTGSHVLINDGSGVMTSEATLAVSRGGTGLASGTSGGVLAYTAAGTLASSGALTASQLVIGGGAGVVPSSLAAGSQYQVLTMGAANPGYSALSLNQAAAVTGALAIGNGGTGQASQTAAFDALSPTTAKGDLIVSNGSDNIRVDVGSNGTVLTADSGTTSGVAWASAAAATHPLAYTSVTGATTLTSSNEFVKLSSSSFTLTLYTAVGNDGRMIDLIHGGTSLTEVYTLNTSGGQTIGGVASGVYKLFTAGETLRLISDGANWQILHHQAQTATVDFTPATTGTFATNVTWTGKWRREGSFAWIHARAIFSGATDAATPARFNLPFAVDEDQLTSAGAGGLGIVGTSVFLDASTSLFIPGVVYVSGAVSYVIPRVLDEAAASTHDLRDVTTTVPVTIAASDMFEIFARVPVEEWQP